MPRVVGTLGLLVAACTVTPRTEVVLVIDSDLEVPEQLDQLVLDITSPDGATRSASARLSEGEPPLPRTLTVLPADGALVGYEVVARGLRAETEIVSRRARFDFVERVSAVLTMHLVASCVGRDCGGQTCSEVGCQDVARTDLGAWTGAPPRLGETPTPLDAGVDAPLPVDAGDVDARPEDGGGDPCTAEVCNDTDDDCDGRIDEDFDLRADPSNCGACGRSCVFRNGAGICNAGECTITSCTAPFDDCDDDASNGCETDTSASTSHCGACGNVCRNPERRCCTGTCSREC